MATRGKRKIESILPATDLILLGLALGVESLCRLLPADTQKAKASMPAVIVTIGFLSMIYFGENPSSH